MTLGDVKDPPALDLGPAEFLRQAELHDGSIAVAIASYTPEAARRAPCYHALAMERQVLIAPDRVDDLAGPLIYLAGPIQGAVDWQREAIDILDELAPDVHVASPRASAFDGKFEEQLAWQTKYQERAARDGVILFWLPRETHHRCNRAYAQQARFELGEWAALSRAGLARVVVGVERGFTGGPYLRRRLTVCYPNVPVCSRLRQTCAVAAELAQSPPTTVAYPFLKELLRPMVVAEPTLPDLVPQIGPRSG